MNELTYNFNGSEIRATVKDGDPQFVAKDVAEALGYPPESVKQIINLIRNVPEEWRGLNPIKTPSGVQNMQCLSEQGLYFFLGRSDKPAALPFQKWIAGEVIPSIRKTGSYAAPKAGRGKAKAVTGAYLHELTSAYDKSIISRDDWRRLAGLPPLAEAAKQLSLPLLFEEQAKGLEFYQGIAEAGGLINSDKDDLAAMYRGRK